MARKRIHDRFGRSDVTAQPALERRLLTAGEFKTASVSAYERGDRAVTVRRAVWLTRRYGTTIDVLVEEAEGRELSGASVARRADVQ